MVRPVMVFVPVGQRPRHRTPGAIPGREDSATPDRGGDQRSTAFLIDDVELIAPPPVALWDAVRLAAHVDAASPGQRDDPMSCRST